MPSKKQPPSLQEAAETMLLQGTEMMIEIFGLFRARLTETLEVGRPLSSLQAIYDLWFTCCSEVHDKVISGTKYQRAYGEMVNAVMREIPPSPPFSKAGYDA